MNRTSVIVTACFAFAALCGGAGGEAYDYPFDDASVATVLGTPREYMAPLPEVDAVKEFTLEVFEDRKPPDVFWHESKLRCSLAYQKEHAPLIFVIAGTGSSHRSSKMKMLQRAFYHAGFHVVLLPSPSHPNFIVSASTSMVPGPLDTDSIDLYRAMELVWSRIAKKVEVSKFYLTGYSLGATQSAFITKLDHERRTFDFDKVLLINPAVNLYSSTTILDNMLADNIPGGMDNFSVFFERLMNAFTDAYERGDVDFNDEFLLDAYRGLKEPPKQESLDALIGMSFRMSLANMAFTSDVLTRAGYVVPKEITLSRYDSLTDYFKVNTRLGFTDFVDDVIYPYYRARDAQLTKDEFLEDSSLLSIEHYLLDTDKISVVTNADDIILAPGELDFLRRVFGARAKIYPNGGHCGNIAHRDFIAYVVDFFKN